MPEQVTAVERPPVEMVNHVFLKPLSPDDQLMVDVVFARYEGVDARFEKIETDEAITLKIPRIRRIFRGVSS